MIGNVEGSVQDLNKPAGVSINNYYSYFTSCFLIDTSYRWSTDSDFISESVMLAGIKAGSIIPIHDIKVVGYIGEEDLYEISTQDNAYISRPGKDRFILKFDFDISFHKRLKSYDHKDYNIVFIDINNYIYGWLNGSLIDGFQTDLIHTQKIVWGSTPEHSWSKMRIDLHDSDQLNKYGIIKLLDFDINDMYFLNVIIQNISLVDSNTIIFQVVDSIYECGINGLNITNITVNDAYSGALILISFTNTGDGYYTLVSSGEFIQGIITIDADRYYGTETYNLNTLTWSELTTGTTESIIDLNIDTTYIGEVLANFRAYAVGSNGLIIHSSDGDSWSIQTSGTPNTLEGVCANRYGQRAWAVGYSGECVYTDNYGATWTGQVISTSEYLRAVGCYKNIYSADQDVAVACGNAGVIFVTTDAGANWGSVSSGVLTSLDYVFCNADGLDIFICGYSGVILKSNNGGVSFSSKSSGVSTALTCINFIDSTKGWCVGYSGVVLYTSDAGETWSKISTITGKTLMGVSFIDENVGYIITIDGIIYVSVDGGISWSDLSVDNTEALLAISAIKSNLVYAAGTNGTILKYS